MALWELVKGPYDPPQEPQAGTGQVIYVDVRGPIGSGKSMLIQALIKALPERLNAVVRISEITTVKE